MLFKVRVVYFKFMATRFNLCFSTRGFCRPGGMSNITKFYVKKVPVPTVLLHLLRSWYRMTFIFHREIFLFPRAEICCNVDQY